MSYAIFNGEIVPESSINLGLNNRAFCYADAVFETMHAWATQIQFLNSHFNRLYSSMLLLGMELHPALNPETFARTITRALNSEKLFKGVRLRLTVFRNNGGLYTPETNQTSFICTWTELPNEHYCLNTKGLHIDIFTDYKKQADTLSTLKTANGLIYVLAGLFKKNNNLDDCLLLNSHNNIIEALSSNIFVVINHSIYTPSLTQGCLNGIMRNNIIEICKNANINLNFNAIIDTELINNADEIFLTNAVLGIQWVGAYKQRRYYSNMAKRIVVLLNKLAFNS